jgi:hypothetical protein
VDQALRQQITKFYQAHVDGKFRLAYEMVAEDSKDLFFAADKEQYTDFSIVKVEYAEDFTRATAVVACGKVLAMFGNRFPVKAPITSTWKVEEGQWRWYKLPRVDVQSPAGMMHPGPTPEGDKKAELGKRGPKLEVIQRQVKVDKAEVKLNSTGASEDKVTVFNNLPGSISLSLIFHGYPGLDVKLDRETLNAKESAVLSFRFDPVDKHARRPMKAWLKVTPTNQIIQILVTFTGALGVATPAVQPPDVAAPASRPPAVVVKAPAAPASPPAQPKP